MSDAGLVKSLNIALGLLGQEPVSALDDAALQQSGAATKLLRYVDDARDTVLARHGWLCALEYDTLTPSTIAGYVNWRYPTVYQLPTKALRVWEIGGQVFNGQETCWEPRWQVGSYETDPASARKIIRSSDTGPLNVAFVRRANWTAMDVHVRDAIGHEIAARGAYSVSGDVAKAKDLANKAEAKVLLAISTDGTQEGGQPPWAGSIPAGIRNSAR